MSLGRWVAARASQDEVRVRLKIGRIDGSIPRVFRHKSDENGVGWSDINSCAAVEASKSSTYLEESVLGLSEPSPRAAGLGRSLSNVRVNDPGFSSVEEALTAAYSTRFLLICDVEGSLAGQAAWVKGDSLGGTLG
jgi:hypothetical protein